MADQRNQVNIPAALVPKVWAKKVWHEGVKDSYFDKFIAMDGSNVVHQNKDLTNVKGDSVVFGLMMNLNGPGVEGNQKLSGAEDTLNIYDFTVQTNLIRNAVSRFEADDQKSQFDMLKEIKIALKQWLADWLDNKLMSELCSTPSSSKEAVAASAAGTYASITANDKLTTTIISRAKRKAMMHAPKVQPIKVDGMDKYIMLVSPWAAKDLKTIQNGWQHNKTQMYVVLKTLSLLVRWANMTALFFMNTNA